MEKNTSTAYVDTTGPIASALTPSGEASSSLFLINLCTSMAPVQLASKTLPGLENYRLYQVTRREDGRTRYRLRLGFFATEAEAEEVLIKVREQYPTAFTACLSEEDHRHTRGYVVNPAPAKPSMTVVSSSTPVPASAPTPTAVKAVATPPAAAKPAPAAAKPAVAPKAPAAAAPTKAASTPPAAKSKIEIPQKPTAPKTAPPKATAAPKPNTPIASLTGLDDLSWEEPSAPAAQAKTSATGIHRSPASATASVSKPQPTAKQPTPAAKPATKPDAAASMRVRALELTLSDPPPVHTTKPRVAPNEPFHVGKGVDIPAMELSLQTEPTPTTKTAPAASASPQAKVTPASTKPASAPMPARAATPAAKTPTPVAAKPAAASAANMVKPSAARHPDLDSTQTIRALTSAELEDESQEKWFAIQLAASEQPVNLDTMPRLDIFEAYCLYSVATAGSGKIVHSLRLGFFREAVSAEAVAGYLKTFFSSPTVLRISVAEHARFKDSTFPKKSDDAASKNSPNVIELDSARASRAPVPTVMEVVPPSKVDASATGTFKMNNTGSFRTSETATHRALTGGLKQAAKTATPPTKRSPPISRKKTSTSGKYKMVPKKSLAEELLEEAKEVELSESGIYKMPKNDSLLSRLVDKLKK